MERLTREDWKNPNSIMWERLENLSVEKNEKNAIKDVLKKLATYEDAQEKIEKRLEEIKKSSCYSHNFTGQMVEDFEWVLGLLD